MTTCLYETATRKLIEHGKYLGDGHYLFDSAPLQDICVARVKLTDYSTFFHKEYNKSLRYESRKELLIARKAFLSIEIEYVDEKPLEWSELFIPSLVCPGVTLDYNREKYGISPMTDTPILLTSELGANPLDAYQRLINLIS